MLVSLIISSLTILITTSQKINEDYLQLTKQQLQLFSNNIFIELRAKMNDGDSKELQKVIEKAKTFQNVADLRIIKSQELIAFQKSNDIFTSEKSILSVFHSKLSILKEEKINDKNYVKFITPIIASDECLVCHKNQKNGDVVSVMEVVFSIDSFKKHSNEIVWNIVYSSLFFGILTIFVLLIIINRATEPIQGLKHGFQRLLDSDESRNNIKLKVRTQDEIGDVAFLFNKYMDKLTLEFKKSTEKFAQNIMDTQTDLVVTFNEDRIITNVNKAFLAFFGVENLNDFITKYDEHLSFVFKNIDSKDFISEYVEGILWEEYIQNNKNKIHKVILQNEEKEVVFAVSANSIVFDNKIYTTSVFTNIDELEIVRNEIEKSHNQLKTLFDNANEGFLYFDRNMIIGDQYSFKAKEILGTTPQQKNITELLFEDKEERSFVQDTLIGILDETLERQEILISLLRDEFLIHGKFIKVEYKVIGKNTFMLILNDITQNKYLNEMIKDEQQVYKMVITVITFLEQFTEVKNDYEKFIQGIGKYKDLKMLSEFRREIHTYKGLFAQFALINITKKLHSLENQIDYSFKTNCLEEEIKELSVNILYSWIEFDLNLINQILKQNIFAKSNVLKIDKYRIENIYKNIDTYDNREILKKEIMKLTYHNIKDTFFAYGQLVRTLSEKFNKPMNDLVINCENIYLSDVYKPFLNSLTHIFRNSLDHGIESQEERYFIGKDLNGTIICEIAIEGKYLKIKYTDDGKGIDIDLVKAKAIEKNFLTQEQLNRLSADEVLMLIFEDSFSTKEVVTDISGRGVGMSSLKTQVELLHGDIKIINHPNEGVEFLFSLPMVD